MPRAHGTLPGTHVPRCAHAPTDHTCIPVLHTHAHPCAHAPHRAHPPTVHTHFPLCTHSPTIHVHPRVHAAPHCAHTHCAHASAYQTHPRWAHMHNPVHTCPPPCTRTPHCAHTLTYHTHTPHAHAAPTVHTHPPCTRTHLLYTHTAPVHTPTMYSHQHRAHPPPCRHTCSPCTCTPPLCTRSSPTVLTRAPPCMKSPRAQRKATAGHAPGTVVEPAACAVSSLPPDDAVRCLIPQIPPPHLFYKLLNTLHAARGNFTQRDSLQSRPARLPSHLHRPVPLLPLAVQLSCVHPRRPLPSGHKNTPTRSRSPTCTHGSLPQRLPESQSAGGRGPAPAVETHRAAATNETAQWDGSHNPQRAPVHVSPGHLAERKLNSLVRGGTAELLGPAHQKGIKSDPPPSAILVLVTHTHSRCAQEPGPRTPNGTSPPGNQETAHVTFLTDT